MRKMSSSSRLLSRVGRAGDLEVDDEVGPRPQVGDEPVDGVDQAEIVDQRGAQVPTEPTKVVDGLREDPLRRREPCPRGARRSSVAGDVDLRQGEDEGLHRVVVQLAGEPLALLLLGLGRQLDVDLEVLVGGLQGGKASRVCRGC